MEKCQLLIYKVKYLSYFYGCKFKSVILTPMKLLLLSFFMLFCSVSSYAQSDSTLLNRVDNIEVQLAKVQVANDSILKQNETLKEELTDHRTKELWFSDLLSINTSWFLGILGIGGVLLGFISWRKMISLKRDVRKEIDLKINEIKVIIDETNDNLDDKTMSIYAIHSDIYQDKIPGDIDVFKAEIKDLPEEVRFIKATNIYVKSLLWGLTEINLNILYAKKNNQNVIDLKIENCVGIIDMANTIFDTMNPYIKVPSEGLISSYESILQESKVLNRIQLTKSISLALTNLYSLAEKNNEAPFTGNN